MERFWQTRQKVFCLLRIAHPRLSPTIPLSQPGHAQTSAAGNSLDATQYQNRPPPSFPPFSPTTPTNPSYFPPAVPSGLIPQDPRLPSLYLPSYDEAVNMQWRFNLQSLEEFICFRMSGYYTTEPPDDSDDDTMTMIYIFLGCSAFIVLLLFCCCCCCCEEAGTERRSTVEEQQRRNADYSRVAGRSIENPVYTVSIKNTISLKSYRRGDESRSKQCSSGETSISNSSDQSEDVFKRH